MVRSPALAGLLAGLLAMTSNTGAGAETGDDIGAVFAFNRICYSQVPNVQAIRNMALQLGWKPLSGEELEAFGNKADFDTLEGWDVQLGVEFYRLGVSQGPVSSAMAEQFPQFSAGRTTSCSLVLGDEQQPETVATQMKELAGKEPVSTAVDEGKVLTTTWAGGNDDFKVFLFNKASKTAAGSILNVTLISRQ